MKHIGSYALPQLPQPSWTVFNRFFFYLVFLGVAGREFRGDDESSHDWSRDFKLLVLLFYVGFYLFFWFAFQVFLNICEILCKVSLKNV